MTKEEAVREYDELMNMRAMEPYIGDDMEQHHRIPLFMITEGKTGKIRNTVEDRGEKINLSLFEHMKAHYLLCIIAEGTNKLDDAKSAFHILSGKNNGRQSPDEAVLNNYYKGVVLKLASGNGNIDFNQGGHYKRYKGISFSQDVVLNKDYHGCIFDECDFNGSELVGDFSFTIFRKCKNYVFRDMIGEKTRNSDLRGITIE